MNAISPTECAGLWVPVITPFAEDGTVDETSLRSLAEGLLADGVDGLVALGTTGEPATLTPAERLQVVEICGEVCRNAGRPLMVGVGTNSTAGTVEELTRLIDQTDTSAALVVTPYYTRPSSEAVVEHFGIIAEQSPVPIVIYNIPYRTGVALDAAALIDASTHRNIVGLKQSVGALDSDTLEMFGAVGSDFAVLAGDDAFIVPTILMGGSGAIAAAAHLCTPLFVQLVAAAQAANVGRAVALSRTLLPVVQAGFAEPSPAVWKGALAAAGTIASGFVRRPLTAASATAVRQLGERVQVVANMEL